MKDLAQRSTLLQRVRIYTQLVCNLLHTLQNWVSTRYTIRYKRISIIVSESIFGEGAM